MAGSGVGVYLARKAERGTGMKTLILFLLAFPLYAAEIPPTPVGVQQ